LKEGYFQKAPNNSGRGTHYLDQYFQAGKQPKAEDFFNARIIVNADANTKQEKIPQRGTTPAVYEKIGDKIARRANAYLKQLESLWKPYKIT
jgi:hypothetical protein